MITIWPGDCWGGWLHKERVEDPSGGFMSFLVRWICFVLFISCYPSIHPSMSLSHPFSLNLKPDIFHSKLRKTELVFLQHSMNTELPYLKSQLWILGGILEASHIWDILTFKHLFIFQSTVSHRNLWEIEKWKKFHLAKDQKNLKGLGDVKQL